MYVTEITHGTECVTHRTDRITYRVDLDGAVVPPVPERNQGGANRLRFRPTLREDR